MASESIGKFMSELRKEKGMTQKEMAEQLGVSDKTISKWETGRGIPDITFLNAISEVLNVSVVELISGKKMDEATRLEEKRDVASLLKEKIEFERTLKWNKVSGITGFVSLIMVVCGVIWLFGGIHFSYIAMFIDIPTLIIVLGLLFVGLCCSRQLRYFIKSFMLLCKKEEIESAVVEKVEYALTTAVGIVLLSGVVTTIVQIIIVLATMSDEYTWLVTYIAVSLLATLYGIVFGLILWIFKSMIHTIYK